MACSLVWLSLFVFSYVVVFLLYFEQRHVASWLLPRVVCHSCEFFAGAFNRNPSATLVKTTIHTKDFFCYGNTEW